MTADAVVAVTFAPDAAVVRAPAPVHALGLARWDSPFAVVAPAVAAVDSADVVCCLVAAAAVAATSVVGLRIDWRIDLIGCALAACFAVVAVATAAAAAVAVVAVVGELELLV